MKHQKNNTYQEIAARLLQLNNILIFPHVNMDGDALGSSSALCMGLRKLGKKAAILVSEDTPKNLDFLGQGMLVQEPDFTAELAIMLDCSGMNRIPQREECFEAAPVKAVIDHHGVTGDQPEFDFGRIEPDSAATGELVALLLREMGVDFDVPIAEALFAAITTDSGNFQHSNTTARTHRIAADLYSVEGFNSKHVSNLIYNRRSIQSIRLNSLVMSGIHMYREGKIAIARVSQEILRETGCDLSECEGFVQDLMSIDGVEVGCLLKEAEPSVIRCSLRSRARVNVAEVASSLGGGGHVPAAGCRIRKPLEEAETIISERIIEQLDKDI